MTGVLSAVMCAELALQRGRERLSGAPAAVAIIAERGTFAGDTEWEEGKLEGFLEDYTRGVAERGSLRRISARPADAASFWISLAERLWSSRCRKRIARGRMDASTVLLLSRLAEAWLEIQGEIAIRVSGSSFKARCGKDRQAWRQLMEWEGGGIGKEELRYLTGYKRRMPRAREKVLRGASEEGWWTRNAAVQIVSRQLLEDARVQGTCEPTGTFRMELPKGMALRELGAHSMRVCPVPPEGIWIALERDGAPGVSFRWTVVEPHLQRWVLDQRLMPLVHLTSAALWRDLRVGGRAVMIDEEKGSGELEEPARGNTRVKFEGRIQWGSEADLETIMRQATRVRWHVRELPTGMRASRRARGLARKLDIDLKPGTTLVRGHRRGEPDQHPGNVPVRAQGLAQLILTERYCTGN